MGAGNKSKDEIKRMKNKQLEETVFLFREVILAREASPLFEFEAPRLENAWARAEQILEFIEVKRCEAEVEQIEQGRMVAHRKAKNAKLRQELQREMMSEKE